MTEMAQALLKALSRITGVLAKRKFQSRRRPSAASSVQTWAFEKLITLARFDAQLHRLALAIDRHRHFDAGLALRPDAAEEAGEIAHVLAGDRKDNVARAQIRLLGRPAVGKADDHKPVLDFGSVKAEPRSRRRVPAAKLENIVDDRF